MELALDFGLPEAEKCRRRLVYVLDVLGFGFEWREAFSIKLSVGVEAVVCFSLFPRAPSLPCDVRLREYCLLYCDLRLAWRLRDRR